MRRWRIEYNPVYTATPLSFWVHSHMDHAVWIESSVFEPRLPEAIPGKGFPMLVVDAFGTELQFASIDEVDHFLDVIRQKNMPSTVALSKARGTIRGPNTHWLSRLPAGLKPWAKREKLISLVERARLDFTKAWSSL